MNILGTEYQIQLRTEAEDPTLKECDGYCDWTTKTIVARELEPGDVLTLGDAEKYQKRVIRHEIIHAFFEESGLSDNSDYAGNEELVDWIAIQFSKLQQAFEDAEAL